MDYITVEQMNEACDKEYNDNYSHGGYCHEQSFRFGFQEGVQYTEKELIEKASKICAKIIYEFNPNMFKNGEELRIVEDKFYREMKEINYENS